jgi:hypothetical protein
LKTEDEEENEDEDERAESVQAKFIFIPPDLPILTP